MNRFTKLAVLAITAAAAIAVSGCATRVKASASSNPPPLEAFGAYGRVELRPMVARAGLKGGAIVEKINANLQKDLGPSLAQWNARPDNRRVLIIEPVLEEIQMKGTASRIFLGPLAGSSGVLMRLNIHDKDGRVVASPEFFQRANAMAAGFLLGVHDNLMLTRVANLSSNYVKGNYAKAVGGPTGGDDPVVGPK